MRLSRLLAVVRPLCAILAVGLAACSGGGDGPTTPVVPGATLTITVGGLPSAVGASILLSGPGRALTVTRDTIVRGLAVGTYTLTANPVTVGGVIHLDAQPTRTVVVVGTAAETAAFQYISTAGFGTLTVRVVGVSPGQRTVDVQGPAGATYTVGDTTLSLLPPGTYLLTARPTVVDAMAFADSTPSRTIVLGAGVTVRAAFEYHRRATILSVNVSGLPPNTLVGVRVLNAAGIDQLQGPFLGRGTSSFPVSPGRYRVLTSALETPTQRFAVDSADVEVTAVPAQATSVALVFRPRTGSLTVQFVDVGPDLTHSVRVERADGSLAATVTAQAPTLPKLEPGNYVLRADTVGTAVFRTVPTRVTTPVTVAVEQATTATVTYRGEPGPAFNLAITRITVSQAIQPTLGAVPLVASRSALVRVFVVANGANGGIRPAVRVELFENGTKFRELLIPSSTGGVPISPMFGAYGATWNVVLQASDLRPGLQVRATVDPDGGIAEAQKGDNTYPLMGTQGVEVRVASPLLLVIVPVRTPGSTIPLRTAASVDSLLTFSAEVHPVSRVVWILREPLITTATGMALLDELRALRRADGRSEMVYYLAMPPGGTGGMASLFGRVSYANDNAAAPQTIAHELGHNFSRGHVNSCYPDPNVDPGYPHQDGGIGGFGWDRRTPVTLVPSSHGDIMGGCRSMWVSDYTWTGVLNFRATNDTGTVALSGGRVLAPPQPRLR